MHDIDQAIVIPFLDVKASRAHYFGDVVEVQYHGSVTEAHGYGLLLGFSWTRRGDGQRYSILTDAGRLDYVRAGSFTLL